MKTVTITKILLIAILTLSAISNIKAQGLQANTYVEQTHVSPKFGTSIGYEFADRIEVGGFFQRASVQAEAEYGRPLSSENEFYGAYFAYPLVAARNATVKFNVRTGVSNGENFVITPSLMASYSPFRLVAIGGGVGVRAFRPTGMATITIRINGGQRGYVASK